MPSTQSILTAINSTKPVAWTDFVHALPDRPMAYTERWHWREIFDSLDALEGMELIVVVRNKNSNDVISLSLTELGAERLRESIETDRLAVERRKNRLGAERLKSSWNMKRRTLEC